MNILKFIQSFSNTFLDNFFLIFTNLGGATIGIILFVYFIWFKDKKYGYKLGFALSFSLVLNNFIKIFVNRKRPIGAEGIRSLAIKTATGTSFPSGHSQGTATTFTSLLLHFKNYKITIIAIFMMVLIPISRLYLGVHWPTDVLFGTIFGIIAVLISNPIYEIINKKNIHYIYILFSALLLISLCLFRSSDYVKAVASFSAMAIGYYLDLKFINYDPVKCSMSKILRLIIGLSGCLIIYTSFKLIIPKGYLNYFFEYFLLTLWATFIAPYIFTYKKAE